MTPWELYLALTAGADSAPSWGDDFIADFNNILSLPSSLADDDDERDDTPHFSLVTGKLVYAEQSRPMRQVKQQPLEYEQGEKALVKNAGIGQVAVQEDGSVVVKGMRSLAGEKLRARSWKGLGDETGDGEEGAKVVEGRSGVARGYQEGDFLR